MAAKLIRFLYAIENLLFKLHYSSPITSISYMLCFILKFFGGAFSRGLQNASCSDKGLVVCNKCFKHIYIDNSL